MIVNWDMIKDLQRAGRVEVPALLRALAEESESLVNWGKENGFDEARCRAAFWSVTRQNPGVPMGQTFVMIRQHLMSNVVRQ